MTNSPLVVYTKISPNKNVNRKNQIDRITPHCIVGQLSAESIGSWFAKESTQASSNYGIDKDGRIAMYVEEKDRSWCTSSRDNDHKAVTIECASDKTHPYAFKDVVYKKLIELCTDICKRNGKTKLIWIADKEKALNYKLASNEMLLTVHRWFSNTACPGDWMYSRMGDLAAKVTTNLNSVNNETNVLYRVQVGAYSKKENAEAIANKLKAAGYDVIIKIDENVNIDNNELSESVVQKKTNAEIANEIYHGVCSDTRWDTWGTGGERVKRLKLAGYDPTAVQKEVNKLF